MKQKKNWIRAAPTVASSASGQIHQPRHIREVMAEPDHGDGERHDGERGVDDSRGGEEMKAVEAVVDGLEEQRVDPAFADVLRDLEIVLARHGEGVDEDQRDEVGDHAGEGVAGEGFLAGEDGVPEEDRAEQRDEANEHAEEKIPAVDEVALDPQVEDLGLEAKRGDHGEGIVAGESGGRDQVVAGRVATAIDRRYSCKTVARDTHVACDGNPYGATDAEVSTPTVKVRALSFSPTITKSPFLMVPRRISSAIGSSR